MEVFKHLNAMPSISFEAKFLTYSEKKQCFTRGCLHMKQVPFRHHLPDWSIRWLYLTVVGLPQALNAVKPFTEPAAAIQNGGGDFTKSHGTSRVVTPTHLRFEISQVSYSGSYNMSYPKILWSLESARWYLKLSTYFEIWHAVWP